MTRIPEKDRDMLDLAIYLPMVLTVLLKDRAIIESGPFKLKKPYINLIDETMLTIQKDLAAVKRYLKQNSLRVERLKRDEAFTMYLFLYRGYEERHNYFNPRLRNRTEELLELYLRKKAHLFSRNEGPEYHAKG
ncbi:hypothetical protein [Bacillus massilinigeriensis]|uniref:hypothetical protein n=1 Tax=Bacillus mediterraneensis TaxID=1805474 RepID=UPI0008F89874|nr:hypothetical protein [Bacillus mediterraneensis]